MLANNFSLFLERGGRKGRGHIGPFGLLGTKRPRGKWPYSPPPHPITLPANYHTCILNHIEAGLAIN